MSENLVKVVNIIESSVNNESSAPDEGGRIAAPTSTLSPPRQPTRRTASVDEVFFSEPTFSERFMRYLMVVIYLCGLCSLGFVLSIYHIFFWDSRMPPVHKSMITKKPILG